MVETLNCKLHEKTIEVPFFCTQVNVNVRCFFCVYCRLGQSASLKFELSSTTYQILNCCLQLNAFWIVVCNLPDFELSSATYQILNCRLQLTRFWIVVCNLSDFELSSATYQILNCLLQLIRFWIIVCDLHNFELSSATYQIFRHVFLRDEVTCGPVGIHQVPVLINVHSIPAMVVFCALELVPGTVVKSLSEPSQHGTV